MRNIIYQYWDGPITSAVKAGVAAMKKYADQINADYVFEDNPQWQTTLGKYSPHYGAFKPLYDKRYDEYDYILFADVDVLPIDNLTQNIFEQFYRDPSIDLGICEEWKQPEIRSKFSVAGINSQNDIIWANIVDKRFSITVPRTVDGKVRVFNSGVVVYSKNGRLKARETFVPFNEYVSLINNNNLPSFYTCDQPYLCAMMESINYQLMDYKWNSPVYYVAGTSGINRPVHDLRTANTAFVHVQLNGKHHMDADTLHRITNLPVEDWNL